MTRAESVGCSCKVGRAIEQYRLDAVNAELLRRRRDGDASLRDLAAYLNQRILVAALAEADVTLTDAAYGAVSDDDALVLVYEALTGDGVPAEREARVRTRLSQPGVEVGTVEGDWVTHPTVRKHLRECLDFETGRAASITLDDARDTIEWARTRCTRIAERTFTRLAKADVVPTGPLDVTVMIRVTCTACGTTYRPGEVLEQRGCACTPAGDVD